MKVVIPLLVLSNLVVAPAAVARDAKEALRDHLVFCSQFGSTILIRGSCPTQCVIAVHSAGTFPTAKSTIGA